MNYTSNMGMNMPDENDKFSIEHFNTNTQSLDIVGKPDEYKNTKTYAVGDLCIHNNILYKCITAVETAEEFNAEKWEVTSLCKEEIANKTAIAELNEKILIPKRLPTGDLNDAYPSSVGITIYICISTDKNIPVNDTGFVESIKYDDNAKIQLFYSLNNNNVYKRKDVGKWSTV